MRILLHSNAPWVKTGYGQQTGLFAPRFRDLGHEVAISAFYGLSGTETEWQGIPVYPAGARPNGYGIDMVPYFYQKFNADIVIILADAWVGHSKVDELAKLNVANWLPVDAAPLSRRDFNYLIASGAYPIAMSGFGRQMLTDANLRPYYGPHGIDLTVFRPRTDDADRNELRAELEITEDTFVVGMNAANRDLWRKGFFEQFTAFARFHAQHPDSRLYVHTMVEHPNGLDIISLARSCGIEDALLVPEQGPMVAGEIGSAALVRNFYHLIDLYSGCSLAEGFGIPIIEAQACGVPVVVTDASAMTELCDSGGWLIGSEPMWVEGHQSRWAKPRIGHIVHAYRDAYLDWRETRMVERSVSALVHASQYDVDKVLVDYWKPILEDLEDRVCA